MTATDPIADRGVRIRLRPWRGAPATAECVPTPAGSMVSPPLVRNALEAAARDGYRFAVTQALPPHEWRPYLDCGFAVREHLHLLRHDLIDIPDTDGPRLHRVGRSDLARILDIDQSAFAGFWRMDRNGLRDAVRATPSSRLRVTSGHTGYALTGRAGERGYIQRLAVRPDARGAGLGAGLVVDGLRWLSRWRSRDALVNTQSSNQRAIDLYHRLGFRTQPGGLAVLAIEL